MNQKVRYLVHGALIGAMYAALTHLQNILLPGTASMTIQMRISEALCVLAFFTPAAIPGLAVGCATFNLTYMGAMPLDALVGSVATALAAGGMYLTRRITVKKLPVLGLCMPAVFNALLVGWELTLYTDFAFWLNSLYVAVGELAVLLTLGVALFYVMKKQKLDKRLFGGC